MKKTLCILSALWVYSAISQNLIQQGSIETYGPDTVFCPGKLPWEYTTSNCYFIRGKQFNDYYNKPFPLLCARRSSSAYTNFIISSHSNISSWVNPDSINDLFVIENPYIIGTQPPQIPPFCDGFSPFTGFPIYANKFNLNDSFPRPGSTQCLYNYFDLIDTANFVVKNHPRLQIWDVYNSFSTISPYKAPVSKDSVFEHAKNKRSYFTNVLANTLIPGQKYRMIFYVRTKDYVGDTFYTDGRVKDNSFYDACDGLGVAFTSYRPLQQYGNVLHLKTTWDCPEIVNYKNGVWKRFSFEFIADSAYRYMTIGNFKYNAQLRIKRPVWYPMDSALYKDWIWYDKGRTSAYMFDDFSLFQVLDTPKISGPKNLCKGDTAHYYSASATAKTYWYINNVSAPVDSGSQFGFKAIRSCLLITDNGIMRDSLLVKVFDTPVSNLPNQLSICSGDEIEICPQTSPAHTYLGWTDAYADSCRKINRNGLFVLSIHNGPCQVLDSLHVRVLANPQFSILQIDTPCLDGLNFTRLNINPDTFPSIIWKPINQNGNKVSTADTGMLQVIVTGSNGCSTAHTYTPLSDCKMSVYVPESFTPNGDGINDIFIVKGLLIQNVFMRVYNRWGEIIFESDDLNRGWDGTFNGSTVPQGQYLVLLEIESKPQLNGFKPTARLQVMVTVLR